MLENFDVTPFIPSEKLPFVNYSLLLSALARVITLQRQVELLSYRLDPSESVDAIQKRLEKDYEHNIEEIRLDLFALYGR